MAHPALQVSIHAPAGGATPSFRRTRRTSRFQSTPPQGGRPEPTVTHVPVVTFQSTPPQGGRPARVLHNALLVWVSIHAPAGGATT